MPRFNPGQFRHQVDVYLPSTALDARGRRTGDPTLVLSGLPCSIEQLQALELIRAQKVWAEATHRVRCFQDPTNPLTERNYLLWGLVALHIGAVVDADNTGIEVELLCKEERQIAGVGGGTPIVGQRPALLYLSANGTLDPVKCNLSATTAPTVNDDAGDGYEVGSQWWDVSSGVFYLCADPTTGAAVWVSYESSGAMATHESSYDHTRIDDLWDFVLGFGDNGDGILNAADLSAFIARLNSFALATDLRHMIDASETDVPEGNNSISLGSDRFLIRWIFIKTNSTDWTLSLFRAGDYATGKKIVVANFNLGDHDVKLDLPWADKDEGGELHYNFTDNTGSESHDIQVLGETYP